MLLNPRPEPQMGRASLPIPLLHHSAPSRSAPASAQRHLNRSCGSRVPDLRMIERPQSLQAQDCSLAGSAPGREPAPHLAEPTHCATVQEYGELRRDTPGTGPPVLRDQRSSPSASGRTRQKLWICWSQVLHSASAANCYHIGNPSMPFPSRTNVPADEFLPSERRVANELRNKAHDFHFRSRQNLKFDSLGLLKLLRVVASHDAGQSHSSGSDGAERRQSPQLGISQCLLAFAHKRRLR